jgi:hypothetical protein
MSDPAIRPAFWPARRPDAGFSLLEIMIAVGILFAILIAAFNMIDRGSRLYGVTSTTAQLDVSANQLAGQIANVLRNGVIVTLEDGDGAALADGATSTTGVRVRLYAGYQGAVIAGDGVGAVLGEDGESNVTDTVDNDKDSIADERSLSIRRWELADEPAASSTGYTSTPTDSRIGGRVESLSVARSGTRLSIAVTVMKYDPVLQTILRSTGRSEVTLRN